MQTTCSFLWIARLVAASSVLAVAAPSALNAQQQTASPTTASTTVSSSAVSPMLLASADVPAGLVLSSTPSYSSSTGANEEMAAESFNFDTDAATQPPPRRTYGRPNYADSHTNADGSNKYTLFGGAGFTLPTGGTHNYLTTSYDFQVGVGRNFNKHVGVAIQFDKDNFGIQTATLTKVLNYYNQGIPSTSPYYVPTLGGSNHTWSFKVYPIYTFNEPDSKFGGYLTLGAGFYHKVTDFTTPETQEYFDPYYGPIQYTANAVFDSYVSNSVGFNAGLGATYKFSKFAGERLYVEGRYVFTDNSPRRFDISGATAYYNVFPQNSAKTTFIPITIGIRF
jgi:hypothetical protein